MMTEYVPKKIFGKGRHEKIRVFVVVVFSSLQISRDLLVATDLARSELKRSNHSPMKMVGFFAGHAKVRRKKRGGEEEMGDVTYSHLDQTRSRCCWWRRRGCWKHIAGLDGWRRRRRLCTLKQKCDAGSRS